MDATRISDGSLLMMKKIHLSKHPDEAEIGHYLSSEPHVSHADNYCVPVYDVLHVPDNDRIAIVVMPFLSDWKQPPFETIGEAVEFFRQMFTVGKSLAPLLTND